MMVTMQYRIILYPLGLLGLVTAYWLYFRRSKVCDAQACRMQGKRWNIAGLVFSTVLMSLVTYVDLFSCFTVKEDNVKNRISFWSCFAVAVDSRFVSKGISTT